MKDGVPKRILFLIDSLKKIGGAEQMYIDQANYFHQQGIEVFFATTVSHQELERFDNELHIGSPVEHFRFRNLLDVGVYIRLSSYIRRNNIDVVYPYLDFSNNIGRINKLFFSPFVRVVIVEPGDPSRKTTWMRIFDWFANFFVYKIFAMGGAVRDNLVDYLGIHRRKILSMRNGVHEMISRDECEARWKQGRSEPMKLFHVGNMATENKGHAALIETISVLKKDYPRVFVHLTLVGDGHMRDEFEMLVTKLGVSKYVTFAGWIRHDEVKDKYGKSDIFVFNSKTEGGAASIMEATSAGLPTITSNFEGVEQVTREGETGFIVERSDSKAFAEKIAFLYDNPRVVEEMGRAARDFYENNFAYRPAADTFMRELFD